MAVTVTVDSNIDKNILLQEANMQSKMIKNLNNWLKVLLVLSGVGIVLGWWGLSEDFQSIPTLFAGIVITLGSILGMLLVQRAIINGRKNVARIMEIVQK